VRYSVGSVLDAHARPSTDHPGIAGPARKLVTGHSVPWQAGRGASREVLCPFSTRQPRRVIASGVAKHRTLPLRRLRPVLLHARLTPRALAGPSALAVSRSEAATGPWTIRRKVPVNRGRRLVGSCADPILRGRRSATRTRGRVARPGRRKRPGGAHGVHPFAVLLLPARLRGVVRLSYPTCRFASHLPR
jgi:hypothetical protein